MLPDWTMGVIGLGIVTVVGILGRLFWAGFQAKIVEAVVNSSLGKLVDLFIKRVDNIDVNIIAIRQDVAAGRNDTSALRQRFEAHVDEDERWHSDFRSFQEEVRQFLPQKEP